MVSKTKKGNRPSKHVISSKTPVSVEAMQVTLHLKVCPTKGQEAWLLYSFSSYLLSQGNEGVDDIKGKDPVFQESEEESHICKPFTGNMRMGSQHQYKGSQGLWLGYQSIFISVVLGHLMSLPNIEVKKRYLFSISNRSLCAIQSFRFIIRSLS